MLIAVAVSIVPFALLISLRAEFSKSNCPQSDVDALRALPVHVAPRIRGKEINHGS